MCGASGSSPASRRAAYASTVVERFGGPSSKLLQVPSARCWERIHLAARSILPSSRTPRNSLSSRSSASIVTLDWSSPFHQPSGVCRESRWSRARSRAASRAARSTSSVVRVPSNAFCPAPSTSAQLTPRTGAGYARARRLSARLLPAQLPRVLAHADEPRRHAADHRVRGHVLGDHRVGADHRVVPDAHPAQDARPVADPDVVAHPYVSLVDALEADRALDLDHPVVEVDQHHAVGDHAFAADRHVLVGGDRALLPEHGLGPDPHHALVAADLGAVPEPRPAPELDSRAIGYLERHPRPDEREPVEPEPPPEPQLAQAESDDEPQVVEVEHARPAHEAQQRERAAVERGRGRAEPLRDALRRGGGGLGLEDRRAHRPAELSGGQQQRVALARALVSRPAVVFADEPTGNLDTRASAEVLALLRRAVDEFGQTAVMVTHDPEAAAYADRLVVLRDGRVVHSGDAGTAVEVSELMRNVA